MEPNQYKILIVDDIQDNLQVFLNTLFNGGYLNILCAKRGEDALRIVDKEYPDLIILDWDMPGMNGIEVLKRLKKKQTTNSIPVIMATGAMLSSSDLEIALGSGAVDYIRKPFEGTELLARVKSALIYSSMLNTIQEQKTQIESQKTRLEENEKRLQAIINASNEACIFIEDDIVIDANQLFYNYTGYKEVEVLQHSFYGFFTREHRKTLTELGSMHKKRLLVSLLDKDGNSLPVEMMIKQFNYLDKEIQVASFFNLSNYSSLPMTQQTSSFIHFESQLKESNNQVNKLKSENEALQYQLQVNALQSANCNDFMKGLSKVLNNLIISLPEEKINCRNQILECVGQLKQHMNDNMWKEFKLRFAEVHTGFYDKLITQYPVLTETDLRLCAFIKLKMSTKEIAEMINQPVSSVKVARNRLRSKLKIEDASEPLMNFFIEY